jgi:pimeloyl-ACP methyl ester carboxylesterase
MILVIIMLAVAIALCAAVIVVMARMLLIPKRMGDVRALFFLHRLTPADIGLEFQPLDFHVIDENTKSKMKLAAWWIPAPNPSSPKTAIILHGYSDAKVGAIAWAPLLRSFGFNVLAVDLRAHGESDGKYTTAGFFERHDISQIIDQLKASHPDETRQLILFGISLGAAVAAATAELRDDLWAVILESPFANFKSAAFYQGDRIGTPGRSFQKPAFRLAELLAHANFDAVAPTRTIPNIRCPVLVIQAGDDPFLSPSDLDEIRAAVESRQANWGPSLCWRLPDCHHVIGLSVDPGEYRKKIEEFFAQIPQITHASASTDAK